MSINIPTHFIQQYTTNVAHLLQIKGGKLRPLVTEASYSGEAAVAVDQYGSVEMNEVVSRYAPMPRTDMNVDRRWVYPIDYSLGQMVDTFDKLRLMVDPQSNMAVAAVKAAERKFDQVLFATFFADAKTGKTGSTTTAFNTTNHRVLAAVGAAVDTGLNVDKILRAKRIMAEYNVDFESEMPILAVTPKQHENLLRQSQVINTDYFAKSGAPVLIDGRVVQFAGCRIIESNLVPANATYRLCPMWVPSGMHLGIWADVKARIDMRPDLEGVPYQLYTTTTIGATRVEEGRVIQIECLES